MRIDALQSSSAFRSWLFSIAKNVSIDSFRKHSRVQSLMEDELHPAPSHDETPHESVEDREERQTVAVALGRLRQRHQRVLVLREVQGLSYSDIADEMDVSESAVETLLFRARRRLREEYTKSEKPKGVLIAIGGLRGMLMRVRPPLPGGPASAAKLTLTAAVVAGSAAIAPAVLPRASQPVLHSVNGFVSSPATRGKPEALSRSPDEVSSSYMGLGAGVLVRHTNMNRGSSSVAWRRTRPAISSHVGSIRISGTTSSELGGAAAKYGPPVSSTEGSGRTTGRQWTTTTTSHGSTNSPGRASIGTVRSSLGGGSIHTNAASRNSLHREARRRPTSAHPAPAEISAHAPRRQAPRSVQKSGHGASVVASTRGSLVGKRYQQRRNPARATRPKSARTLVLDLSIRTMPHKPSHVDGSSRTLGGAPGRTEAPAHPQARPAIPVQPATATPTANPAPTPVDATRVPPASGTSANGGNSRGGNVVLPTAQPSNASAVSPPAGSPTPATVSGNRPGKPRP
jgi:RNA polymerase sigma factor (sigma-70 family)